MLAATRRPRRCPASHARNSGLQAYVGGCFTGLELGNEIQEWEIVS